MISWKDRLDVYKIVYRQNVQMKGNKDNKRKQKTRTRDNIRKGKMKTYRRTLNEGESPVMT